MTNLLCLIRRHVWTRHTNPEVSGPAATYSVCSRCGKERQEYDGRTQGPGGVALGA